MQGQVGGWTDKIINKTTSGMVLKVGCGSNLPTGSQLVPRAADLSLSLRGHSYTRFRTCSQRLAEGPARRRLVFHQHHY